MQATEDNERVKAFLNTFQAVAPVYSKHVMHTATMHPELFRELAGPMLRWSSGALGKDHMHHLIQGYVSFVTEINQSQLAYEQARQYTHSRYAEVSEHTYQSPEFMSGYHWGVYVTTFGWSHHLELYRFYRDMFLTRIKQNDDGTLLDFGAGSCIWTFLALNQLSKWHAHTVDISETSVRLSRSMVTHAGLGSRISFLHGDAQTYRFAEQADAAVSCFLLEHLENPAALIANIARGLKPRGYAFITAALTASEIDHIREFRRETEVATTAEEAGFRVVAMLSTAPAETPADRYFLPRSVGYILQKRAGEIW